MKAHKVPATYYDSWNIPGMKHSFYIFYKSGLEEKGKCKSYRKVGKITQEHAFFMEEDFYYLNTIKVPGLFYKLENEIEDFLRERAYNIECFDYFDESNEPEYPIIEIKNYDKFMYFRGYMDSWMVTDANGNSVPIEEFKNDLYTYLFDKVGTIIEETYFANELEPKWNVIKTEIVRNRNNGEDFDLIHKEDFLEFFVIQYRRVEGFIAEYIDPIVGNARLLFSSLGYEEDELNEIEEDGLLASETYFFAFLLDAARGNKIRVQRCIKAIEEKYNIDLFKASPGMSFLTSTEPCVVTKNANGLITEMFFPVTPKYCIRFKEKTRSENRNGKYFEITPSDVLAINQRIISESPNIVISECKKIIDKF